MTIRLFRQHIRGPFLALALTEAFILFVSVYVAAHLRYAGVAEVSMLVAQNIGPLLYRAAVFSMVMLFAIASMGLYRAQHLGAFSNVALRIITAYVLGALAMMPLFYAVPALYLGRGVFVGSVSMSLVALVIVRLLFTNIVNNNTLKRRVLVYGAGEKASIISGLRRQSGFYIVGFVQAAGETVRVPTHKLIQLNISLLEFSREEEVDEIVVALQDRRQSLPLDELLDCRLSGINIIDPTNFLERETGKLNLAMLGSGWMIFFDGFVQSVSRGLSQRLFDIAASVVLLILTSPIMLAAAIAIRLESGNGQPILYRQRRIGRNNRMFEILKFRSMRVDAEPTGEAIWATEGDLRVTRVGAVMRKYRIDELPQVFNVLRGDMSLVGPRPERPEFVESLDNNIPLYRERHRVRPGLAGWAQMHYPYGDCEHDAYQKLQYDLYYIKNGSLFLDFMILLQTAEIVLWGKGAR